MRLIILNLCPQASSTTLVRWSPAPNESTVLPALQHRRLKAFPSVTNFTGKCIAQSPLDDTRYHNSKYEYRFYEERSKLQFRFSLAIIAAVLSNLANPWAGRLSRSQQLSQFSCASPFDLFRSITTFVLKFNIIFSRSPLQVGSTLASVLR